MPEYEPGVIASVCGILRRMTIRMALVPYVLAAAATSAQGVVPPAAGPAEPLAVMTFNIRYGTAQDGENRWNARRELLIDVIREQAPDVLGLQEALDYQVDEVAAALPAYAVVGVGRDDGRRAGEYAAILFRKERLRVAESGTFWFSDTPEVPGSRSWGNNITRICTWARFVDRDGRAFWHFNVHLDHQSQPSRERSAQLLRQRIDARAVPAEPVVVTGDFNVGETNPALETLRAAGLLDTYRVLHPDERRVGTFTGFKIGNDAGDKIDYVIVQAGTTVLTADIIRTARDGRYPSDHFPVVARIVLP